MANILLGPRDQFTASPTEVKVGGKVYFLIQEEDQYTLLSARCPHAGFTVEIEDDELVCPLHGWTFELHTGRCHNVPSARLQAYPVLEINGQLYAELD
ncbi:Rieske (2Fe-2S) protein [Paenibacillus ferrarius]|uniref:Rieske (2Fe-2S) protein n=1 Tax=Paenibacillus ferrarius TaxID=1469647 RepID=UPI003D2908C2